MSSIPVTASNSIPISTSGGNITFSSNTTTTGNLMNDGSGNLVWSDSTQTTHAFSKHGLNQVFKEFAAGKFTRKYAEVYLDFMFLNAMLDNLEYLEYKVSLDKELQ